MPAAPPPVSPPDAASPGTTWTPAPSGTRRTLAGFLRVLDLDASSTPRFGHAFEELRRGALQAIVVQGVFDAAEMARAADDLARHDPPFLQTRFPPAFKAWFYGRNLNLADPALRGYFDEAARFRAQLDEWLPLEQRVCRVLSQLDGGRPFAAAPGVAPGQRYMVATLRAHLEGGFIPPHFDNEVRLRPSYRHLAGLVDEHIQSFVLTIDPGLAGGALEVFDVRCEPDAARLLNDDHAPPLPDTGGVGSVLFRLPPGAVIVLDSGRFLHRVTPVRGARTRWTACAFMARARSGEGSWLWG